jgi:hypothetical protein
MNTQPLSNFHSGYSVVSKNHCLGTLHVFFHCGCGWASLRVCIGSTDSAAFKHFGPLVHTSLWQTVLSILSRELSWISTFFHFFVHQETHCCTFLVVDALEESLLCHAHLAQMDCNWTALAVCHRLILSYNMTRTRQCCQSYNENVPIVPFLFEFRFYLNGTPSYDEFASACVVRATWQIVSADCSVFLAIFGGHSIFIGSSCLNSH